MKYPSKYAAGVATFALLFSACAAPENDREIVDLLVTGGTVYTGADGDMGRIADIAVRGERIIFIGDASTQSFQINQTLDATGMIVAPGFIDPHTHTLDDLMSRDTNQLIAYLTQGVTTVVAGNDGGGPVDTSAALSTLKTNGIGPNAALFIGHNSVREQIIGSEDRVPTSNELNAMTTLVQQAMDDGALGLSSGLYYAPGAYAQTEELVALSLPVARSGGLYESHIRDESSYNIGLVSAVDEVIEIGRQSGAAVHIAHIKALGADVWGESGTVIDHIERAQSQGVTITADQYPWSASGTRISNALIPNWAKDGGVDAMIENLKDPALADRLRTDVTENLRIRGGPDTLLITGGAASEDIGTRLDAAAVRRNLDPIDAAIEIVVEGDARIASFNMIDIDIEAFMRKRWVLTSSDGTNGHPRKYASFPRKYRTYVIERQTITLADFIHRSTGLTADTLGLCDRGYLRPNRPADIVVFDPGTFAPNADFSTPDALSSGVASLIVNGEVAIVQSKVVQGMLSGQSLRRGEC